MHKSGASPIVLVDGSSYLFRAFHGLPPLTNSKGKDTGAIYGVVNMLRSLVKDYTPEYMAVIFDAKGKTFRDDIFPEYKANRPPMPEELASQIPPLHEIVKAMGFPLIIHEGVEADDVIGTLAVAASKRGQDCVISTGDKDMAQLVDQHVTLINTMNKTTLDIEGVNQKFGIPPKFIIDFLALKGDKVDNIPGVPGVGDKSAIALLTGIGGVTDIFNNLDKIENLDFRGAKSMATKITKYKEQAELSYELATIKTDVKLALDLSDLQIKPINKSALQKWFKDLEFKRWLSEVSIDDNNDEPIKDISKTTTAESGKKTEQINKSNYKTVITTEDLEELVKILESSKLIAVDTETTSVNYMQAALVGLSFATGFGDAWYIPVGHTHPDTPQQLNIDLVLAALRPILESKNIEKVGQHIKYDQNVLAKYDIRINNIVCDTMLASYVLNSTATRHDMDSLALKYLGHKCISFEQIAGKGAKQITFDQIDLKTAAEYAAEDADVTLALYNELKNRIDVEHKLSDVLLNIEIPVSNILANMEQTGVLIDADELHNQSFSLSENINHLESKVHDLAGEVFNLGSPKQLQKILFDKLGLPVIKKTPKGVPSTSEEVLQELSADYELPKLIIQHRGLSKLKNTYTEKLPKMINTSTGRVHTSYHQATAATGRLSSSDPNLQNIPIRTPEGRQIRQAFIAREGYQIVAADYSQIELRIMAHLSLDKGLLKAFQDGKDIHKATAAEIFSLSEEDVQADQRRSAKAINFGLIYGMSAFGLSRQLNISRKEAQLYMDTYFERYPGVRLYMNETRELAKEHGYVSTVFGRRLYLPDINASNAIRRAAAERAAINAPMQGTAADIIKKAMIQVDGWIQSEASEDSCFMIMQVHDELVFEIQKDRVEEYSAKIIQKMEQAAHLQVPLIVDADSGDNWDQAH